LEVLIYAGDLMLDRLESKLGRFAIPGLITAVATGQALFYFGDILRPGLRSVLLLDPWAIRAGQWWRLFSFVLYPPSGIFGIFSIYILNLMGMGLERAWGAFKLNVFYFTGMAAHLAVGLWFGGGVTPENLHLSLVLAFAALYPDFELLIFFVLPFKMRWLAWLTALGLLYKGVVGGPMEILLITLSLANYLLFFGPEMLRRARMQKEIIANRSVFVRAEQKMAKLPKKICNQCGADAMAGADIRLCHCPLCGPEGKFWCVEHLGPHLKPVGKIKPS
jgi:hypothetical protein